MFGLPLLDCLVVLAYLGVITWIGLRAKRHTGSAADFFMPRAFGKWMLTMAAFGTGTSSEQAVTVASKSYVSGASGIWYQWQFLFSTPFVWIMAPLLRRLRAVTTADIFEARFDRSVARLFCAAGLLKSALSLGLLLKGTGAVLVATSGGRINGDVFVVALTVSLLAYSLSGGLAAAIVTEFLQSLLTILFSFLLLPYVLHAVGGMGGMKALMADPQRYALFASGGVSLFHMVMLTLSGLAMMITIPHNLGSTTAGRREADGQVGFVAGAFIKRVCTAAWCLTGLAGAAYFAGREINPDHLYGLLAQTFLPVGLLGLFIASVLAAAMSACSSMLIAGSALVTNNLYRGWRPERAESHYVNIGRLVMIAIAVVGLAFAYGFPGMVKGLEIILALTPIMGIGFWLGFFWRRLNAAGIWAGTGAGYLTWAFCEFPAGARVLGGLSPAFLNASGETSFPWRMVFIFVATILGGVIVSLLTAPPPRERIEAFYALARTPVSPGERVPAPCTLPVGALTPPPREWLVIGTLHIPRPETRTLTGFGVCWLLVVVLIAAFAGILTL